MSPWRTDNRYFWLRFFFSLKRTLKPVFEYKIIFGISVLVLWIHKGYVEVNKLMENVHINALWFGLANAISNYLRLKILVVCVGYFKTLNTCLFNLSYQIWVRIIFVYQKSLKRTLKIGFWLQNLLRMCYCVVNLQMLFCSHRTEG